MVGKLKKKNRSRKTGFHRVTALILLSIPFTLSLFGCIVTENRQELPIQLPESFSIQGETPLVAKWWLDFNDDNLTRLITVALTDNLDLLSSRDRILEAAALARQSGAVLKPELDVTGNTTTSRNYQTDSSTDSFSLGLAAAYEIDLWGRLRATRDAELAKLKATEADYATAALSLAAEVAISWFELVENRLQIALLKQQQETNAKVLEVITTQLRAGKTGIADVLQQRQLVESNQGSLAQLQATGQRLEHQLLMLLGQPLSSTIPTTNQLPVLPKLPKSGIPLHILTRRPDVTNSYLKLKAADFQVAAAVGERFPRFSISASLTTSGDRVKDLFNDWFTNLGANLLGPLLDGGLRLAEVDRRKAIAGQHYYQYGQTLLNALVEVENSLVREKELQLVVTSLNTQLQLAAETIEHVGTRYRQGAENYQRVLQVLLSHQSLQRQILSNRKQRINNRVALYRALSGPLPPETIQATRTNNSSSKKLPQ